MTAVLSYVRPDFVNSYPGLCDGQGCEGLKKALTVSGRNLGVLNMTDQNLRADRHDKWTAHNIDNSVLKLRRRRNKHRWVMGGVFEHSWE